MKRKRIDSSFVSCLDHYFVLYYHFSMLSIWKFNHLYLGQFSTFSIRSVGHRKPPQSSSLWLKYLVRSLFWSVQPIDPLIEIDRYCTSFDNQYGAEHPVFYRGKLSQVGLFRAFALFTVGIILGFNGCPAWSSTAIYLFAREKLTPMRSLLPVRTSKHTGR